MDVSEREELVICLGEKRALTCIISHFVADLRMFRRFPLLDLAMSGALETAEDLEEWLLTYDVGCQYIAHLLERWKEWDLPDKYIPIVEKLRILLPQMHMLAHQESCQTDYCMGFKKGTGHTCGEIVETIWAEHNAVGLSTREMNGGARRDALNDFFNSWNWYKNEGRGKWSRRMLSAHADGRYALLLQRSTCFASSGKSSFFSSNKRGIWRRSPRRRDPAKFKNGSNSTLRTRP